MDDDTQALGEPDPTPKPKKRENAGTEYVVLARTGEGWEPAARTTANAKAEAVKNTVGGDAGDYKAVPARSWDGIIRIEVEQVQKVTAEIVED